MQYVANLSIGTPAQHLLVLLDTGSSEFFLPGPISNTIHDVFEVTESSTFKGSEEEWSVEYGAGTTHGQVRMSVQVQCRILKVCSSSARTL